MSNLIFRVFLGAFLVFAGVAGVSYMQKRFDRADERKALEAVLTKVPGVGDSSSCRTEMRSRALGDVRVTCGERAWTVNILSATIRSEPTAPEP